MPNPPLSIGASGQDVATLQEQLNTHGFLVPAVERDAKLFGPATQEAVRQFQEQHGLTVSGLVDDATANALNAAPAQRRDLDLAALGNAPVRAANVAGDGARVAAGVVAGGATVGAAAAAAGAIGAAGAVGAAAGPVLGGEAGGAAAGPTTQGSVQGSVAFDYGLPASGITLRLYSIGFGGQEQKLVEVQSDMQGHYTLGYQVPQGQTPNVQVRAVDPSGKEVPISATKFNAQPQESLNLIVPNSVQPLASEYQRLAADMDRHVGGIAKLAQAQEDGTRQDLTLVSQTSGWDARIVALAATAAQQTAPTGMGQDALYALYRAGLPTDPQHLAMVPVATVQHALATANKAGVVSLNDQQVTASATAFAVFARKTQLGGTSPGAASAYGDMLTAKITDAGQQAAFADLYFGRTATGADFWKQAAALNIPAATIDGLKLQGKFLHLTFNNAALAAHLQQDIGSLGNLSQLVDKDYHDGATWKAALTALAGAGGDAALQKLIPEAYQGASTADRLEAYAADLARKVRLSFPTRFVARAIEKGDVPINPAHAAPVATYLKAAEAQGFQLGRTPLNRFLQTPGLPALDSASTLSLKTLHRLYQLTPSHESLQAALKLGFTSAHDLMWLTRDEFLSQYAHSFPSYDEAVLVYGKAQQISSVTFNFLALAKHLDTSPTVYGLSPSADDRQTARNALVQQFPALQSLFGSLDFCQCDDCRSVLSPAAYLVDLLDFLRQSAPNDAKNTPLDVLVGKDQTLKGRRPDLQALPLTCENTNTAMPYIDLVNEILEYYIANNGLDAGAAYDTGTVSSADLVAEPQHVLSGVYTTTLKQARYPLNLPFDLWIETVRGFLDYFKAPLAQVLDTLRPADTLELFTDANHFPYYRAQILAESLGLSPADYAVLTSTDPVSGQPSVQAWYQLYGYGDENTALNGQVDPNDATQYLVAPLEAAKNLAERLGVTYQELTDLVQTGFVNPGLNALLFQFQRFGISLDDAFAYTGQVGSTAQSTQAKADFEAALDKVTQRYKQANSASTFDAKTWLKGALPAGSSAKVLVLSDASAGCDFTHTTLQYADSTAATRLDFLKLNLFVRLWKKLGWTLDETDRALQLFLPANLPAWTDPTFAAAFSTAWKTALVYLAHLNDLAGQLSPALGRTALLPLWANLPTLGASPLYAQLFLTPGVLNADPVYDDPTGGFPGAPTDALADHQLTVQAVLDLSSSDVAAILTDAGAAVTTVQQAVNGQNVTAPTFSLSNLSICYRYSLLAQCLQMPVTDLVALKTLSGLNLFQPLGSAPLAALKDDVVYTQTLTFLKQAAAVQASSFSVEDLRYLLRHQFDPVGKYQQDDNANIALAQTLATGLRQLQAQYDASPQTLGQSGPLIEQRLAALFPAPILKALFALLSNTQTYQAVQGNVTPDKQLDPTLFAAERALAFSYDATTQTQSVSYRGLLTDWKKAQLKQINTSPLFSGLLDGVQQQAQAALDQSVGDILGVWASLASYEAVRTGVPAGLPVDRLTQVDPALSTSYDQAEQLQWLAYRGVLTDARKAALKAVSTSQTLASLLDDVQQQAMPNYRTLMGALLAAWASAQTYQAIEPGVAAADQLDPTVFLAYPAIAVSYDSATQTQTLTYRGVLTDARRVEIAALVPASRVLSGLVQAIRDQDMQLFQEQAAGLLMATPADVDGFCQPFAGLDDAGRQLRVKTALVQAFLPLQAGKLSRQLVVQTLASILGTDPTMTDSLLTDAGLLGDPSAPGRSLLGAFLGLAQPGVSATYFAAADGSGAPLAAAVAATVDTADASNPNASKPGTGSAHLEGYLQVPTDGPYRFYAELGNQNATVTLHVDAPTPAALVQNPVVQQTAAKDHDEASGFVQLSGGVPYHFTVDFQTLGTNGASMLIQGELLPKGPLSQVMLYPQAAVDASTRARVLLAKVAQIVQGLGLDEREIGYLAANSAQFANLDLGTLPTQASDDTPVRATALFAQFLALADYADLRAGPAGGTDGLIGVFEQVGQPFTEPVAAQDATTNPATPWRRLADLTRRDDPQVVRDVARALGLIQEQINGATRQVKAMGDFGNNKGIRRIWQALQLVHLLGIPVAAMTAATAIVTPTPSPPPETVAGTFKNAVRARYTRDVWQPIAQSVFDTLRQRKRDALVAYLVHALELANADQLFEYFLVDPGMEPVVHTSRVRLALSSVQTFIQRCLLNLENGNAAHPERNVTPGAIRADWWEWMKRYRVWQANREIFLFPENWMEPELRLDKTDLFQTLEGALLQGDVTRDLVEDAFLTYLKGLDERARLDVVATYLDQDTTDAGHSTLHVVGRTYGHPHKYFYRNYSDGTWSGWEAVTPSIDGDHITAVVWRGRLNLFWVTFMKQADDADTSHDATKFSDLGGTTVGGVKPQRQVRVQLHWSEYYQDKWSNRISTDMMRYGPVRVDVTFDPHQVYIHVSKEVNVGGGEGALRIHLDFPNTATGYSFRVTGKNGEPAFGTQYWEAAQTIPYTGAVGVDATQHTGSGSLQAQFQGRIVSGSIIDEMPVLDTLPILQSVHNYAVLPPANPVVPSPFLDASEPAYQQAGSLVAPFFFKDTSFQLAGDGDGLPGLVQTEVTMFAQPSLKETTTSQWEGWAIEPPVPDPVFLDPTWPDHIDIVAQVPTAVASIAPALSQPDPTYTIYAPNPRVDWATHPATAIAYGGTWVGQRGGITQRTIPASAARLRMTRPAVNGASATAATGSAANTALTTRLGTSLGFVLVGGQGLGAGMLQSLRMAQVAANGHAGALSGGPA